MDQSLSHDKRRPDALWILGAFLTALAARAATLGLGTDVDTGGFCVMSRSMSEGLVLYRDIRFYMTPLSVAIGWALHGVFGDGFVTASRLLMAAASASAAIPVFIIGREIFDRRAGFLAALLYALDPLSIFYARQLHPSVCETILSAWTVCAMIWALRGPDRPARSLLAGAAVGVAFIAKQPAIALAGLYPPASLLFRSGQIIPPDLRRCVRNTLLAAVGGAAVLALLAGILHRAGALEAFWNVAVAHNFELRQSGMAASDVGTLAAKARRLAQVANTSRVLWLLAASGLLLACRDRKWSALIPVMWLCCLAAFMAMVYYESHDHYFLPWSAPASLLAGYGAAELWRTVLRSVKTDSLSEGSLCILILAALAAAAFALKFRQLGRPDFALMAAGMGCLAVARMACNRRPEREHLPRWRAAVSALAALGFAAGWVAPYFLRITAYPEPYVTVAQEKTMAHWMRQRLQLGEHVAVLGSGVITLYGGWPQLPAVIFGRQVVFPWGMDPYGDTWRVQPRRFEDTIALWNKSYNVRYVMIYADYWDNLARDINRPLREYLQGEFHLIKEFDWKTGDYYGHMMVLEKNGQNGGQPRPPADRSQAPDNTRRTG